MLKIMSLLKFMIYPFLDSQALRVHKSTNLTYILENYQKMNFIGCPRMRVLISNKPMKAIVLGFTIDVSSSHSFKLLRLNYRDNFGGVWLMKTGGKIMFIMLLTVSNK